MFQIGASNRRLFRESASQKTNLSHGHSEWRFERLFFATRRMHYTVAFLLARPWVRRAAEAISQLTGVALVALD